MRRIELEPEDRTWSIEIFFAGCFKHVAHREQQRLDRESARIVQRDERPTIVDKLPERFAAFRTHSARIGRWITRRQTLQDFLRRLIGKDDYVEVIFEFPRADD